MSAWELTGVWDIIQDGVPPSKAVAIDVPRARIPGLVEFLGVRSLSELDRMSESDLYDLLGRFTLPPKRC